MATNSPWNQEYDQSYPVGSSRGYVTHFNRGRGHTKSAEGEYCNVVQDHCIDHKTAKVYLQFSKRKTLINKLFSE